MGRIHAVMSDGTVVTDVEVSPLAKFVIDIFGYRLAIFFQFNM